MDTKRIQITDYDYPLPDERIAKFPLAERDSSKLLVYDQGKISQTAFRSLPELLPEGALMVFNNTRVIQARLHFRKAAPADGTSAHGALIEVFLLEPAQPVEYQENFARRGSCTWYCLVGNQKKWKEGALRRTLTIASRQVTLQAERIGAHGTSQEVRFTWDADLTWAEVIDAVGELPIPPYLNRETQESDKTTYQTVYARIKGSVAAPTAGLHFTDHVLHDIDARGIERAEVTLHVGAGTFRPVKSHDIGGHDMHTEHIAVHRATLVQLLAHKAEAIAVGTTSVRTLESLYYMGVLASEGKEELHVPQWLPYEYDDALPVMEALQSLLHYMDQRGEDVLHSSTQIIIAPGYHYHIVRRIITNFHQPQSTLLLLVSAFVGEDWHRIYDYALSNGFRFLSYGDSSLLIPKGTPKEDAEPLPYDNKDEMLPVVDIQGNILEAATRGDCHGGSMKLHPVVHLHLFNSKGDIYLQKRPQWKDIQPGKWDTAVGGHVDLGESVGIAIARETYEELGIRLEGAGKLIPLLAREGGHYVFESERERELVYPFKLVYNGHVKPSRETDGGRFWTLQEVRDAIGKDVLTPNFEQEFLRLFGHTAARTGQEPETYKE